MTLTDDLIIEKLCSPAIWAEGPVWLPQQDAVVFSDVKGNRMFRWQRSGELQVWRSPSNYTNGNALDGEGRIISCEHGRRGISRTEHDGSVTMLVEKVDGKRFNSPNDVVVRSDGTIWFTDPPYGIINDEEGYHALSQVIGCYLYCFDPASGELTIAASDLQRPNGLAFSPDESLMYVADMSIVDFPTLGRRELRVYTVDAKRLYNGRRFAEVAPGIPDGFCVDPRGYVWCSCDDGVIAFDSNGRTVGKIPLPERVSNCTLGGPDGDELYITATRSLYRVRLPL